MPLTEWHSDRTQQPQEAVAFADNFGSLAVFTFAPQLHLAADPWSGSVIAVNGSRPTIAPFPPAGIAAFGDGSNTGLEATLLRTINSNEPWSFVTSFTPRTAGGQRAVFNFGNAAGSNFSIILRAQGSDLWLYSSHGGATGVSLAGAIVAGRQVTAVGSWDGANLVLTTSAGSASVSSPTSPNPSVRVTLLCGGFGGGADRWDGSVDIVHLMRGSLGEVARRSLAANPWQIFAPQTRRIWVGSGTVAAQADITPGSYVSTFSGIDVAHAAFADVTPSSYAATFSPIDVVHAARADITPASYAATFAGIDVSHAARADITPASYAATFSSIEATKTSAGAYQADITPGSYAATFTQADAFKTSAAAFSADITPGSYVTTFASIAATYRPVAVANIAPGGYATTFAQIEARYSGEQAAATGGGIWFRKQYRTRLDREAEERESKERAERTESKAREAKRPTPPQPEEVKQALSRVAWVPEVGYWPIDLDPLVQRQAQERALLEAAQIEQARAEQQELEEVFAIAQMVVKQLYGGNLRGDISMIL
jgi:hypothetical protein